MMKLTIKGNKGTLEFDVEPTPSKSGKMVLLATTHGNSGTDTKYDGKQVFANVNIGVYATEKEAAPATSKTKV